MRIAITVSQISPGGGLTKYVCTLTEILTDGVDNEIWVITTHPSKTNPLLDSLTRTRKVKYIALGDCHKLKRYSSLVSLLRKFAPDVIINNYNATTQYVLPLLSKKCKVVHILHNDTSDFYRVASINGKYVDRWIAPTPALKEYFDIYTRQKYRNRVVTIPHGVEPPKGDVSKSHPVVRLAFVGVLFEHKGVRILPDIIHRLLEKGHEFHFTFIGEGILRRELECALQDEIKNGVVDFSGRISGDEVYQKLSNMDIFVYPTHIDAFGLVIAEAMINSVVPVITRLEGITDALVDDAVNGYLVPRDDVEAFVERISKLIEDESLRIRMRNAAAEKAFRCFTFDVMKKNYIEFIEHLTAECV